MTDETEVLLECPCPLAPIASPVERGEPASGPCLIDSEGEEDEPAVEDERTVLDLKGLTGVGLAFRMAMGPVVGDEERDEREGFAL